MPSVGSTPTTSPAQQQQQQSQQQVQLSQIQPNASNATRTTLATAVTSLTNHSVQQHTKLQQQHSLPLQLQYQVTTTQPSPAGMFISQTAGIISSTTTLGSHVAGGGATSFFNTNGGDISPISSTGSFSSVDTNQTLLNSIVNQQQVHSQKSYTNAAARTASSVKPTSGRSYRTKYSQFMIITPAVSIDRDFERATSNDNSTDNGTFNAADDDPYLSHNGNIYRMSLVQSSIESGNSSDSGGSFRSNYNPYLHTSRQHLLPKSAPPFCTFSPSSWGWCTLICAAMRCFGTSGNHGGISGSHGNRSHYSTSFIRRPYQRSRSSGPHAATSKPPHRRLRSYSTSSFTPETAFEHFSAPFKNRKTRDHLNNITYEL